MRLKLFNLRTELKAVTRVQYVTVVVGNTSIQNKLHAARPTAEPFGDTQEGIRYSGRRIL